MSLEAKTAGMKHHAVFLPLDWDTKEGKLYLEIGILMDQINEFEKDPAKFVPSKPVEAPRGMPIGDDAEQ